MKRQTAAASGLPPTSNVGGMSVGGTKAPAVKKGTVRVPSASKGGAPAATTGAKKKMSASQMLEAENKKMEEKLKVVQGMIDNERSKRSTQGMKAAPTSTAAASASNSGSSKMWRSSTQSSNYAKQVLEQHKKALASGLKPSMSKDGADASERPSQAGATQSAGNPFISGIAPPQNQGPQTAASNLKNALNFQADEDAKGPAAGDGQANAGSGEEYPEVGAFLNSISLEKYKDRFIENGIEDEETILELSDDHLDALTVPLGHKLKILKRIKMLRQEKGMSVPESRQGQRQRPTGNADVGAEVRPVSKADYSELPPPTQTGKTPVKSALKNSNNPNGANANGAQNVDAQKPGGSLLEGRFDEGESHNSFLDALKAWRGDPTPPAADEPQKSVRFQGDAVQGAASGKRNNFFANLGEKDHNVNCLPEPPSFNEEGTKPDDQLTDPKFGPKDSCWQCYKLYPRGQHFKCSISDKKFCKELCLQRYETDNIMKCQLRAGDRNCGKKFVKANGIFYLGKYFCQEVCINDDDDIRRYNEMEEQAARMQAEEDAELSDDCVIDL